MTDRPEILLDEPVTGLDVYLKDLGWNVVTVRDTLGAGKSDDDIVAFTRNNRYVLVTMDRKLAKRCRNLGTRVVEIGLEDFAKLVHESLTKEFRP
jgi:predicted nuclease of predicted toxin-antitoxin system